MRQVIEWILHVDKHLRELMDAVGAPWLYTLLFLIVFCETGLVIMPFLPGDSLLFAAGSLCALDGSPLSLPVLWILLVLAAVLGDAVNYSIGYRLGPKVFRSESSRYLGQVRANHSHVCSVRSWRRENAVHQVLDVQCAGSCVMGELVLARRLFSRKGRVDSKEFLLGHHRNHPGKRLANSLGMVAGQTLYWY